jgi:hemolysin D
MLPELVQGSVLTRLARQFGRPPARRAERLSRLELAFLPDALELEHTPPSSGGRAVVWCIVVFCLIATFWACYGQVDVVSTSAGKIIPSGKLKIVQSVDGGRVHAILAQEGQSVSKGDVLVELEAGLDSSDLRSSSQRLQFLRAEKIRLGAELDGVRPNYDTAGIAPEVAILQESLRLARNSAFQAKLAEAGNAQTAKEANLSALRDGLNKLEASLKIGQEKEERVRPYIGSVMTRFDYLKLKDDLNQLENNVASQRNALKSAVQEARAAAELVQQTRHEHTGQLLADLSDCNTRLAALGGDVEKAGTLVGQKRIVATVDGKVQLLSVTSVGQVVAPGQTVATLVAQGQAQVIEAYLSNEEAAFVHAGQAADIKVDAFPFQHYGSLSGVVLDVSPDAEEKQLSAAEMSAQSRGDSELPTKAGLMYKLRVRITGKGPASSDEILQTRAGMTVQVDIKTDRRRIIEFFLEPMKKYLKNSITSR